jgi:DNA modification methylase
MRHFPLEGWQGLFGFLKIFSKKGSLVVDPFLGSGTTALACKNTGRKCFGTELNSEYYNICLNRCK